MTYTYSQPGNWGGLKAWVFKHKGRSCYLCSAHATQVDHIIPVAQGGTHDKDNLAPICVPCHAAKSERERLEGIERRKARKPQGEQHPNRRSTLGGGNPHPRLPPSEDV